MTDSPRKPGVPRHAAVARRAGGVALTVLMTLAAGGALHAADAGFAKGSERLVERLETVRPGLPIVAVRTTPMDGVFAIELKGGTFLYGSADGRFLIAGDMYEMRDDLVNLAEEYRSENRVRLLADVPKHEMVVFSPKQAAKTYVTVFTDVDCGYCRKLHQEMAEINALGIEVRYLAYPRAGLGTNTAKKIVSAWCAKDPNSALTALKAGATIPTAECENPVGKQYALGQEIGVTGTPSIITEDGRMLPGYMPAEDLAAAVGI